MARGCPVDGLGSVGAGTGSGAGTTMDIGIIGSGNIGGTTARLFAAAGHAVVIANSRGPDTLADLVAEVGDGLRAGTVDEAARHGELVLVAIPMKAVEDLPPGPFAGKIVVDANNYYPGRDGQYEPLDTDAPRRPRCSPRTSPRRAWSRPSTP